MNRILEILLTIVALAGLYSAMPKPQQPVASSTQPDRAVLIADGSDPMPLCYKRKCVP